MKSTCAASVVLCLACIPWPVEAQESHIEASAVGVPTTENSDAVIQGAPGDWKLGESIRSQWVLLDENRTLRGRIGTLDSSGVFRNTTGLEVRLYQSTSGGVTWEGASTDANGVFEVHDLSGGVYQLVATGQNGFLAFSLILYERGGPRVENARRDGGDFFRFVQLPLAAEARFDVVVPAVPPTFTSLNRILAQRFPEMVRSDLAPADHLTSVQEAVRNRALGHDMPGGPLEKQGLKELEQNQPGEDQSIPSTTIRAHEVPLINGEIRGRLFSIDPDDGHPILVENVSIYVLRDDRIVYRGRVIRGEFSADLVDGEGDYSIVAVGRNGFGASSFYARAVADEEEATRMMGEKWSFVSLRLAQANDDREPELMPVQPNANRAAVYPFAMALINDPKVLQDALPQIAQAGMVAQPFPPAAGPGVASGGGASGGGGLAWLLGGAGLATGITALATDDDDPTIVQPPTMVTPFMP